MSGGHSVLVVPVPEVEDFVRERTAFYDASFCSTDPAFSHAHLTLLGPWLADPSPHDLEAVARVAAAHPPFDYVFDQVAAFPDGVIHLLADDPAPFRALTRVLVEAFPQCPPYAGEFPDPVPHVTLDRIGGPITPASVHAQLADRLPLRGRADRLDLQWWANHDCRVLRTWPLRP